MVYSKFLITSFKIKKTLSLRLIIIFILHFLIFFIEDKHAIYQL